MNQNYEQNPNFYRPLPDEFSSDERALDALIAQDVANQSHPKGLTDRIYTASVDFLPVQAEQPALRFPAQERTRLTHPLWGRLALAACLVLAFFVFIRLPSHETLQPVAKLVSADEWDWMNARPTDNEEATVGYLLDTSDLSSDDILGDLASLVQELDM